MKHKIKAHQIAAICFIICYVGICTKDLYILKLIKLERAIGFNSSTIIKDLIQYCFFLLVPVGIFFNNRKITGIGFASSAIFKFASIITNLNYGFPNILFMCLLPSLGLILAAIVCFTNRENLGFFFYIGAVTVVLMYIYDITRFNFSNFADLLFPFRFLFRGRLDSFVGGFSYLGQLICAVGYIFLAIGEAAPAVKKTINADIRQNITPVKGDRIERLTKLKGLFDKGIITQEEFDAKKKEILE